MTDWHIFEIFIYRSLFVWFYKIIIKTTTTRCPITLLTVGKTIIIYKLFWKMIIILITESVVIYISIILINSLLQKMWCWCQDREQCDILVFGFINEFESSDIRYLFSIHDLSGSLQADSTIFQGCSTIYCQYIGKGLQ